MATDTKAPAPMGLENLKSGTECWAWQYDWPKGLSLPLSSMKPVRGILAECPDRIGDASRGPGWFVPYSGKSRRPAFTKAVRVEAVNVHSEREAAEDAYNAAVRSVAARLLDLARLAQSDIVRTERDGYDKDGLKEYPVMRPDLSMGYSGILAAMDPRLELLEDHGGDVISWESFEAGEARGIYNPYLGDADLLVDGKGSETALMDLHRGLLYIPDEYAVPFNRIAEAFAGHEIQVLWFPKQGLHGRGA